MAKIKLQGEQEEMKILNELRLKLDNPNWAWDDAEIGVLITMEEPTKHMRTEAASSGFYDSPWGKRFPRLQILTIDELLKGKGIDYPPSSQVNVTYKKAPKTREEVAGQEELPLLRKKGDSQ